MIALAVRAEPVSSGGARRAAGTLSDGGVAWAGTAAPPLLVLSFGSGAPSNQTEARSVQGAAGVTDGGTVAGATVGALVFLCIVGFVIVLFLRHRRRVEPTPSEASAKPLGTDTVYVTPGEVKMTAGCPSDSGSSIQSADDTYVVTPTPDDGAARRDAETLHL
eukprot:TRINITY_DN8692_c0_g1_i1.p5 TRINITY_DN8692_c0_g1~~TRINITY_DN8692_c0_g1_i1.p5  ORF type:complete len:163 (+),score=14.30 TRINITY_DN8692_c0_g1_i1:2416-2904(+)